MGLPTVCASVKTDHQQWTDNANKGWGMLHIDSEGRAMEVDFHDMHKNVG